MTPRPLFEDASILADDSKIAAWFSEPARVLHGTDLAGALQILNATERDRFAAFRFEPDRLAYLAAHVLLRRVWGRALGVSAREVSFRHDSKGRPMVVDQKGTSYFTSLSRRRGLVAAVISKEKPVGIDVEEALARPDAKELLARFLGSVSHASACLEIEADGSAFGRTWTLIEAFAKVRGSGLADSLSNVNISALGDGRYELVDASLRCAACSYSPDRTHWVSVAWQCS